MEVFKPKPIEPTPYYHCTIHAGHYNEEDEEFLDDEMRKWFEDDELDVIDLPDLCCGESDCNDCQTHTP